jgi:hypothetical protein
MKIPKLKIAAIFVLVVSMLSPAVTVLSAPALDRRPLINFNFTGIEVSAFFGFASPDPCIVNDTQILAIQEPGTEKGSGPRFAYVFTTSTNFCTGQTLSSAFGAVSLSPNQMSVDQSLGAAALKVTVPVYDRINGNTVDFNIDLKWIATSEPEVTRIISHETFFDGTEEFSRSNGTSRDAIASGTVSEGSGNVAPNPIGGSIDSVKSGELTLTAR